MDTRRGKEDSRRSMPRRLTNVTHHPAPRPGALPDVREPRRHHARAPLAPAPCVCLVHLPPLVVLTMAHQVNVPPSGKAWAELHADGRLTVTITGGTIEFPRDITTQLLAFVAGSVSTALAMTEAEEAVITSAVRFYAAFGARSEEAAQKALIQAVKDLLASEPNQKEEETP